MKYVSMLCGLLAGCQMTPRIPSSDYVHNAARYATEGGIDPILSYIGGAATVCGIIALVLTRGSIGTRAVVIGIGLVLLNQIIALYSDWLFVPVLVATGAISLVYGYRTVVQILRYRNGSGWSLRFWKKEKRK